MKKGTHIAIASMNGSDPDFKLIYKSNPDDTHMSFCDNHGYLVHWSGGG